MLTVRAVGVPVLDADLCDGGEDGTVSATFFHHVNNPLHDPFNWSMAAPAVIRNLLEENTSCILLIFPKN